MRQKLPLCLYFFHIFFFELTSLPPVVKLVRGGSILHLFKPYTYAGFEYATSEEKARSLITIPPRLHNERPNSRTVHLNKTHKA